MKVAAGQGKAIVPASMLQGDIGERHGKQRHFPEEGRVAEVLDGFHGEQP